ncbi:MAG: SDR family oxidoreductase [Phycisphaerae bacterium]
MDFHGKTAVITGAASGIGRATCEALARAGTSAIGMVDRSPAVRDFAASLNEQMRRDLAVPFVGDVTSDLFRQCVYRDLKGRFGAVHICIPAAGITRDRLAVRVDKDTGQAETYSRKDLEEVFAINLVAPICWALDAIGTVAEERARRGQSRWEPSEPVQGGVVFIGSVSSAGNRGQVSYAAAKAGLDGAQATLAKEAIYYGIRSNIIHPGYTDTPMVRALGQELIEHHILPHTQLRRLLQPEEIADAIVFMLRNSAVSGSLWVDAGWHPAA